MEYAAVRAVKGVKFGYESCAGTVQVLSMFRSMVNEAIRICLTENIRGRFNLRNRIYREFMDGHGVASCYPYSVAEVAWSIVKKHRRWQRTPVARHPMMKLDASAFTIQDGILSLAFGPGRNGQRISIRLKFGAYQRTFLEDASLRKGSVTITEHTVVVAFPKEIAPAMPVSKVAFDINEKSLVSSDGDRYDLSEIARLQTEYGSRRASFQQRHNEDVRLVKKVSKRSRQRARIGQRSGNRHGETDTHTQIKEEGQREWQNNKEAHQQVALLDDAEGNRVQGGVGRRTRAVRQPVIHFKEMLNLWQDQPKARS